MDETINTFLSACDIVSTESLRKRLRNFVEMTREHEKRERSSKTELARDADKHFNKFGILHITETVEGRVPPKDDTFEYDTYDESESSMHEEFTPFNTSLMFVTEFGECMKLHVYMDYSVRCMHGTVDFSDTQWEADVTVRSREVADEFRFVDSKARREKWIDATMAFMDDRYGADTNAYDRDGRRRAIKHSLKHPKTGFPAERIRTLTVPEMFANQIEAE